MAHKGRFYPLSIHRSYNGNSPYPLCAAARYELAMPGSQGTWGDGLSHALVRLDDFGMQPGANRWIYTEPLNPLSTTMQFRLFIGQFNDGDFPILLEAQVWAYNILVPGGALVVSYTRTAQPGTGLHAFFIGGETIWEPLFYQILGGPRTCLVNAIPWGG